VNGAPHEGRAGAGDYREAVPGAGAMGGIAGGAGSSSGRLARAHTPRRALVAVVAAGMVAITAAATVILLQRAPRRAGTNLTGDVGYAIPLGPGQQLCEGGELLPGDTGALKLDADTQGLPGPALAVSIGGPGGPVSTGGLKAGWRPGAIRIPVARVPGTIAAANVCLRNLGPRAVTFGGSVPDSGFLIELAGKPLSGRLRIEYMRPGRESWLELLPTLAHRFSLAKADLMRHWAAGAALVLMALAVALAARTILKEEESSL
jgi:hypothetical protein